MEKLTVGVCCTLYNQQRFVSALCFGASHYMMPTRICCIVIKCVDFMSFMSFSASFLPSFTGFASLFWFFVIYSRFLFRWIFWGFYLFAVLLAAFRSVLFCLFCFFRIFWLYRLFCVFCFFFPKRRNRTQKRFAFFIAEEASFNSYVLFNSTASSDSHASFVSLISRFIISLLGSFKFVSILDWSTPDINT